jgi:hypothetical protein
MFLGHNKKLNPLFYVHEGVYAVFLHICIEVVVIVGKSNKMDRIIHMRSHDVFVKHCGFISFHFFVKLVMAE